MMKMMTIFLITFITLASADYKKCKQQLEAANKGILSLKEAIKSDLYSNMFSSLDAISAIATQINQDCDTFLIDTNIHSFNAVANTCEEGVEYLKRILIDSEAFDYTDALEKLTNFSLKFKEMCSVDYLNEMAEIYGEKDLVLVGILEEVGRALNAGRQLSTADQSDESDFVFTSESDSGDVEIVYYGNLNDSRFLSW